MRESISYTFLLNIVIVFVFTCFAIVMGILSYYKAFRANSIISETIEKYEGYNCVSAEEIARKLGNIGYNTPFDVNCNGKGDYCMTDTSHNYAVVSYNLDIPENSSGSNIAYKDSDAYKYSDDYSAEKFKTMNSTYECDSNGCVTNKHYQYGIYTYMYVELPVISSLMRIPFFSKTSIMYEFRNFYVENDTNSETGSTTIRYTDVESSYDNLYSKEYKDGKLYVNDAYKDKCQTKLKKTSEGEYEQECVYKTARYTTGEALMNAYAIMSSEAGKNANPYQLIVEHITGNRLLDYRTRAISIGYSDRNSNIENGEIKFSGVASNVLSSTSQRQFCGYIMDYSTIN